MDLAGVSGVKVSLRAAADRDAVPPQAVDLPPQFIAADMQRPLQFQALDCVSPAIAVVPQIIFQLFACHFSSFPEPVPRKMAQKKRGQRPFR